MNMKAEELISRKCHNIESKSLQGHLVVIDKVAFEAVELARTEEREKAIEIVKTAYKNALYECKTNKGTYKNPIYIFEDLMKNCDKLLNQ